MKKILFVSGVSGNGGTQTWTREYLNSLKSNEFKLIHINLSSRRGLKAEASIIERIKDGLLDLREVYSDVRNALRSHRPPVMHTATSGSLGTLRDYVLIKLAHKYNTKGILHCHYGCISQDYKGKGPMGWLLRRTLNLYDQVWVLDSTTESFLKSLKGFENKVFLTPNFIEVDTSLQLRPKKYKKVAFIGNLVPTKGIFELTQAVKQLSDTELLLIGPAEPIIKEELEKIIGRDSNRIHLLGRIDNKELVKKLDDIDIIALPTYYPWEAFPISILEAMSHGCLVLSCPRAAIPDMLTDTSGNMCGLLVEPRSISPISDAIRWCQENCEDADIMRYNAYDKVKKCYSKEIVFKKYTDLYKKLI